MEELHKLGLWGDGLILIDTDELINRYNDCLLDMGLEITSMKRFHVDCVGWSPEIAEEKGDIYYLSHGEANQMAIIIMPEQRKKPLYVPFHSFDLALMKQWFATHKSQIVELTKTTGIWLYIDQHIQQYHEPSDMLMIDNITVRANTPSKLITKAAKQKNLIRQFMEPPQDTSKMSEMLMAVPQQLVVSLEEVGNVANRQMVIEDMMYSVPCSFYTKAFDGQFIVRSNDCEAEKIIPKDHAMQDIGVTQSMDKKILRQLERFGLISYEMERWTDKLDRLKIIRDSFLMDVLAELEPDFDYSGISTVKKAQLINRPDILEALPKEYNQLDRLITKLQKGQIPKKLPKEVKPFFAHPLKSLDRASREVIWFILCLVCDGRSVVRLYRYDKDEFIGQYKTWSGVRRSWAVQCIQRYNRRLSTKISLP